MWRTCNYYSITSNAIYEEHGSQWSQQVSAMVTNSLVGAWPDPFSFCEGCGLRDETWCAIIRITVHMPCTEQFDNLIHRGTHHTLLLMHTSQLLKDPQALTSEMISWRYRKGGLLRSLSVRGGFLITFPSVSLVLWITAESTWDAIISTDTVSRLLKLYKHSSTRVILHQVLNAPRASRNKHSSFIARRKPLSPVN